VFTALVEDKESAGTYDPNAVGRDERADAGWYVCRAAIKECNKLAVFGRFQVEKGLIAVSAAVAFFSREWAFAVPPVLCCFLASVSGKVSE
jgi:hypothetical protein